MEGCDACSPKALRKAYIAVGKAVLASEDYVDDLPVAFMHLTGVQYCTLFNGINAVTIRYQFMETDFVLNAKIKLNLAFAK